jgi:hypothetical protein
VASGVTRRQRCPKLTTEPTVASAVSVSGTGAGNHIVPVARSRFTELWWASSQNREKERVEGVGGA